MLVVGGHTRNIGKTALVVDLLRAFPNAGWTAVKITQYGHGICSRDGEACDCAPAEHTFALDEERDAAGKSDTSRFLAAGAAHSLWLRAKQGRLAEALPLLRGALDDHAGPRGNVIIESNSLLQFVRPQLYLVVLDPSQRDFKDSARLHLDRADALVIREGERGAATERPFRASAAWNPRVTQGLMGGKQEFRQALGRPLPGGLIEVVRERMFGPGRVPR